MKKLALLSMLLCAIFGLRAQTQSATGGSNKHPIAKANGIDPDGYPATRRAGIVEGELPVYIWYNRDALGVGGCSLALNDLYVVILDTYGNIIGSRSLADFVSITLPSGMDDINDDCTEGDFGIHKANVTLQFAGDCIEYPGKIHKKITYEIRQLSGGTLDPILVNTPCMDSLFPSSCFVGLNTQLEGLFLYYCIEDDPNENPGGGDPGIGGGDDDGGTPKIVQLNNQQNHTPLTATPNPFTTQIDLQINAPKATQATIILLDLQGRQLYASQQQFEKGFQHLTIPTADLPNGIYFLSWQTPTNIHTVKLLKNTPNRL